MSAVPLSSFLVLWSAT